MAHETLLTVFIIIAAVAIVLQALAMLGIYAAIRRVQGDVKSLRTDLTERVDPITQTITEIVKESREPLRTMMANLSEVSRTVREGTTNLDAVLNEVLEKFRAHLVRIDQTVIDVLDKVDRTTSMVQRNIVQPVTEVSAIAKGLKAGVDFFLRRRPTQASDVPQDEQMFI